MKKRTFWHLLQGRAASAAACWHATSEKEYEDIRRFGIRAPVTVVANGIDVGAAKAEEAPAKRVLYLGRLHPKKGVGNLVAAWARLEAEFPDWSLDVVGPDEAGHGSELSAQAERLQCRRAAFRGSALGEEKSALYRQASLFVLPTMDENFGMTVAEALSFGTPVICTKGAPWSGLDAHACGWWIDHGVEPLEQALRGAMSLSPGQRLEMGRRGYDWMGRDFSWERIAGDLTAVYLWLAGHAERPMTVRLD